MTAKQSYAKTGFLSFESSHPMVQVKTCGGDRIFGVNRATAILHAVADGPLVNIQPM
jgi:hypothetical protein